MDASAMRYKGYKSPTLHVVYLGFVTGTLLLMAGLIDQHVWEGSVLGLLTAYVVANGLSKGAEAYTHRPVTPPPLPVGPETPGQIP